MLEADRTAALPQHFLCLLPSQKKQTTLPVLINLHASPTSGLKRSRTWSPLLCIKLNPFTSEELYKISAASPLPPAA